MSEPQEVEPQDVDLAALEKLSNGLVTALAAIEEHQWKMATPCADWDLAALVDHVTGGNWFTIKISDGRSASDATAEIMEQFGGTSVSRTRAVASVGEQLSAFRQIGMLDRTHHHVAGELTGRQILRLRIHDLIVHLWDIDQTLAPPATISLDLVRWGLNELADEASQTAKHLQAAGTVKLAETEDAMAAYLQCFGRRLPG